MGLDFEINVRVQKVVRNGSKDQEKLGDVTNFDNFTEKCLEKKHSHQDIDDKLDATLQPISDSSMKQVVFIKFMLLQEISKNPYKSHQRHRRVLHHKKYSQPSDLYYGIKGRNSKLNNKTLTGINGNNIII